jgi:Ca-activated chloride channel family protein
MKFLYPEYLQLFYLLGALVPCWLYFLYTKRRSRHVLGIGRALERVSRYSSLRRDVLRCLLLNLVMAALILAIAHPLRIQEHKVPKAGVLDVIFLLDTSPSMRALDIQPSRLRRALDVIGAFSRAKLEHDRIGLVSFAGASVVVSHLTEDANNIFYYLEYLREDATLSHGTNIGSGLANALGLIQKETEVNPQAARNKKVIILLSDGEDNSAELDHAVTTVKSHGVKVHTVGVGSLEGAPIPIGDEAGRPVFLEDDNGQRIMSRFDERTLQWIAEKTGGKFYRTLSGFELDKAFFDIARGEREVDGFRKTVAYQDFYQMFLFAAAGIFFLALLTAG